MLKLFLLLISPLWVPFAMAYGLARICGDGLVFVLEGYGIPFQPSTPVKLVLYPLAIALFPILITIETTGSFLRFLGGLPVKLVRGDPNSLPAFLRILMGLPVFALIPIWVPIVVLVWVTLIAGGQGMVNPCLSSLLSRRCPPPCKGG